jgi:hypothetical protein
VFAQAGDNTYLVVLGRATVPRRARKPLLAYGADRLDVKAWIAHKHRLRSGYRDHGKLKCMVKAKVIPLLYELSQQGSPDSPGTEDDEGDAA